MVDDEDSSIIRKKDVTTGPPRIVVIGVPVLGSVVAVFLVLLVIWLWATARAFIVPQSAMAPAIFGGDEIRADATAFGFRLPVIGNVRTASEPARGDVIVFDWPSDRSYTYVMRVVAVAGDDVQVLQDGSVDLQGKPLRRCAMGTWPKGRDPNGVADGRKAFVEWSGDRAYVILLGDEKPSGTTCVDSPCKVPPGKLFVLGDNRSASQDSRHWGFVPVDHVLGKVKDPRTPDDLPAWNTCLTATP
jgi:signal peptidase I